MNTNLYAPPVAAVADVDTAEALLARRSKLVTIISINAALFGVLLMVASVATAITRNMDGGRVLGFIIFICFGLLIVMTAIGLFRHRLWAAVLWLVLNGLMVAILVLALPPAKDRADWVLVGLFIAQFMGSIVGAWIMARRRATIAKLRPIAQVY